MQERYKSKLVVDLLLERINEKTHKKEILLSLRQNTGNYDNQYDLPGGHVEANEDLYDAMIREAQEEIGIKIRRKDLKIIHIFHRYDKGVLKFVFKTTAYENEIKNCEENICEELKWIEIDNLPNNIINSIKIEIENIKRGVFYDAK